MFSIDGAAEIALANNVITDNTVYAPGSTGGGLFVIGDTLNPLRITLTNNTITRNTAESGGGIFIRFAGEQSTLTLVNNIVTNNNAAYGGGGINVAEDVTTVTMTSNVISQNTAGFGGGMVVSAPTFILSNNVISQNRAARFGGGISVYSAAAATLTNNTITQNAADVGGGIEVYSMDATLTNNTITQNTANVGGGISVYSYFATLTNNTISQNAASTDGGGVWVFLLWARTARADIYNNIIWANRAARGSDLFLENDGDNDGIPSPVSLFSNDLDKSPMGVFIKLPFPLDPTNLDVDPGFVGSTNGDYHLGADSPVIDRGDNTAPRLPATDRDGNPRILHGVVDMGADEYTADPTVVLGTNQPAFRPGEALILAATATPGLTPRTVDAYVALALPDGTLLFLPGLSREPRPVVTEWTVAPFTGELFRYDFTGGEPAGRYTWLAAFTEPGTLKIIGEIAQAPFTFAPWRQNFRTGS